MIIAGNKTRATSDLHGIIVESLKAAYAENRPVNWDAPSWANGLSKFNSVASEITTSFLRGMFDRGDVPYVKGRLTHADLAYIQECVNDMYFSALSGGGHYIANKAKMFRKEFSKRAKRMLAEWKESTNVYFRLAGHS